MICNFNFFFSSLKIEQYNVIYYEPDGDRKYQFITKPKLVTVPDSEILQVSRIHYMHALRILNCCGRRCGLCA